MVGALKAAQRAGRSQHRRRHRISVDPVALLKREHEMIREQLRMIEAVVGEAKGGNTGAASDRRRALPETDRTTLRELLRFFTSRVGVHFRREAVLMRVLGNVLGGRGAERDQFATLVHEHRALKADASKIARLLASRGARSARLNGSDPLGILDFVRHYQGHIDCEERILYVLADMRLTDEQKQRIGRRMLEV
jgi:hemerythrin-like domain-containing protein